ncbi:MAG TPA: TIGR02996 domain-containing protein [Urbifossiella sp.]|nr:TIGR02996 domain-containing protein [Urbifossiella sp.]
MDDETAFLAALLDRPADDTTRLVYVDWLEERGDIRGEFLRCAVAARTSAHAADLPQLLPRLRDLRPAVSPAWVGRAYRALAEDDIREVVFRRMLDNGLGYVTFVGVEGRHDPSPYLSALLAELYCWVFSASAAEFRDGEYREKQSGERGRLISLDGLTWEAEDRCTVNGEFFYDGLGAQGNLYRVGVRDGWWAVSEVSELWVS